MDETLTVPSQAVKTAGQTLSWKSKFKHFDLQHLNISTSTTAAVCSPPTSSAGAEREREREVKYEDRAGGSSTGYIL